MTNVLRKARARVTRLRAFCKQVTGDEGGIKGLMPNDEISLKYTKHNLKRCQRMLRSGNDLSAQNNRPGNISRSHSSQNHLENGTEVRSPNFE